MFLSRSLPYPSIDLLFPSPPPTRCHTRPVALPPRLPARPLQDEQVVGQRIYLPNIVFRLMYNQTAFIRGSSQSRAPVAMEQYNPYIATFRIPKALTKPDIKSYLKAVYNLDTTFVRTDVRNAPNRRIQQGDRRGQWTQKDSSKSYKRAVVGLTRPFHYPGDKHNVEPAEKERLAREKRDREEAEREQRIYEKKMQDRRIDFSGTVRISSEGKPASVYGPNVQPGDRVQKCVCSCPCPFYRPAEPSTD